MRGYDVEALTAVAGERREALEREAQMQQARDRLASMRRPGR